MRLDSTITPSALLLLLVGCAPAGGTPHPVPVESPPALAQCGPAPDAGTISLESQLATPPHLIAPGRIRYPDALHAARVNGRVRIAYVIDPAGRAVPSSLMVLYSTDPGFVDVARSAILEGRWAPGVVDGHPAAACVATTINFTP